VEALTFLEIFQQYFVYWLDRPVDRFSRALDVQRRIRCIAHKSRIEALVNPPTSMWLIYINWSTGAEDVPPAGKVVKEARSRRLIS
jgi:hypothetical protein